MRNFSSPPCALTTTVCVSSRTSLPSRVLTCTITGICSITRSLRRRFAGFASINLVSARLQSTIPHEIAGDLAVRKGSATSLLAEFALQSGFYIQPFRVEDAEINGVPDAAACGDHVIAKSSFFARADAQNRGPRALV